MQGSTLPVAPRTVVGWASARCRLGGKFPVGRQAVTGAGSTCGPLAASVSTETARCAR